MMILSFVVVPFVSFVFDVSKIKVHFTPTTQFLGRRGQMLSLGKNATDG